MQMKGVFYSKGLKVNLGKTNVMVSCGIARNHLSNSKVDPCGVCSLRVKLSQFYVVC